MASDGDKAASATLTVTVVDAGDPIYIGMLSGDTLTFGGRQTIPGSVIESSFDGEGLTFSAGTEDTTIVDVDMDNPDDPNEVTITALQVEGTATVTITATDEDGDMASHAIMVEVRASLAPVLSNTMPDLVTLDVGGDSTEVDVASYFDNHGLEALTYQASADSAAVSLSDVVDGMLTITPVTADDVLVEVTATNTHGSIMQTINVTVNATPPVATGMIPAQTIAAGGSRNIALDQYFTPGKGSTHDLTYTESVDGTAATALISGGDTLVITAGSAAGSATITVTATDGDGEYDMQTVSVTVTEEEEEGQAPTNPTPIPPQKVVLGEPRTIDISGYFTGATSYTASGVAATVMAAVTDSGMLTLTPVAHGTVEVRVTAINSAGQVSDDFDVTVQARPMLRSGKMLDDMRLAIPGDPTVEANLKSLDLTEYFEDPDGTIEKYSTMTSAPKTLAVYVSPRSTLTGDALTAVLDKATEAMGSEVLLEARAAGTAMVTVKLTDDSGLVTTKMFEVTVVQTNASPERVGDEAIVASPGYTGAARLKLGDDPKKVIDDAEINDHFLDADLVLPAGDLLTFTAKYVETGGAVDADDLDADAIVATASISPTTWDGDIGGVDKFTVTVTPTKAGAAHDILIIATDRAGATAFKRLAVQVNQAPVAKGDVADGSDAEPGTLTKLSEDFDDLALSTGFSTVDATSGHQVVLVIDDGGYFSDADNGTSELTCRFNKRGASIFEENYPQWSDADRRQLNLASAVGVALEAKGTAYIDVWCTDPSGESSPMDTLTITVATDGSIH